VKVIRGEPWGFILHQESPDGLYFFVPAVPKNQLMISMQHQIVINQNLIAMIKTGDHPFFFDSMSKAVLIQKDSRYAKEIIEAIMYFLIQESRR